MDLRAYFAARQDQAVDWLRSMVEMESPTTEKASVDRLGSWLADRLRTICANVTTVPQERVGNHLVARWGSGGSQVLILGHMDTVWDLGTLALRPVQLHDDGRITGPGVFDMKGGLAITLTSLTGLYDLGLLGDLAITLLLNSDEEQGSRTSRELIEVQARCSRLVLCLEPALAGGAVKTFRKGTGLFRVVARGRSSHAGSNHRGGINAIEELAHQVLALQRLTDYSTGTTVNVGRISGGMRSNVVPAQAECWVDVRYTDQAAGEEVMAKIYALRPHLRGAELQISGGLNRPVMLRDDLMRRVYSWARGIAAGLGMSLEEGASGGGSDASFTAALGKPTLDGLGAMGDGAHAIHEYAIVASLPDRAALLTALLLAAGTAPT